MAPRRERERARLALKASTVCTVMLSGAAAAAAAFLCNRIPGVWCPISLAGDIGCARGASLCTLR